MNIKTKINGTLHNELLTKIKITIKFHYFS